METLLQNAVKATVDVVNARLKAVNNADYMAALSLAEKARYGPITEAYQMAEYGVENSYGGKDYYNAALNVAEFLDYIITSQENRLNDALENIVMGGHVEEDNWLASEFEKVWGEFKDEAYKHIPNIVVLNQTSD